MSNAVEIAKVLVSPTEKLIDVISKGVGRLYEPHHIKKMAEARAFEIATVGGALNDYNEVPTTYDSGKITMHSPDSDPFKSRIDLRVSYQEAFKQRNLDAVVEQAKCFVAEIENVINDPVDMEWTLRFINTVEYINSEELQFIWAALLVSKIRNPKNVSLRAIDLLKNMSLEEVSLFQKILPYVFVRSNECFLFGYAETLAKMGLDKNDILLLDECGILLSGNNGLKFRQSNTFGYESCFHNSRQIVRLNLHDKNPMITFRHFPLTRVGCELYQILRTEPDLNFLKDTVSLIASLPRAKGSTLTIHDLDGSERHMLGKQDVLWQESGARIPTVDSPININQATAAELNALPSITVSIAGNIVSYREKHGPFNSIEDLRKVAGIGQKRLDKLSPCATV